MTCEITFPFNNMTSTKPLNNVAYWIQNLDFGTFLGLVDDVPVGRAGRKATLVSRHKKPGIKTQEVGSDDSYFAHSSIYFVL